MLTLPAENLNALSGGLIAFSAVAAWTLTYGVRRLALRAGAVASPDDRRRHVRPTPLLGGTVFYVLFAALTGAALLIPDGDGGGLIRPRFALCFFAAVTLVYGVGVVDDIHELKALPKLIVQLLAANVFLLGEPQLPPIFQDQVLHPMLIGPILILWIVGVTNAMNMIDGLDGLCTGLAVLAGGAILMVSLSSAAAPVFAVLVLAVLVGAGIGFLFHNFHPARIFLGDSGSLVLGFVLAAVSVSIDVKRSLFVSLSLPIFVLGVPLLDVLISVVRRRRLARPVFRGDRSHLHHRLQHIGLSHRTAVIFLWLIAAYLSAMAYVLAQLPAQQSFLIYMTVIPSLGLLFTALLYLENRLSMQNYQYSHLFLKSELDHVGGRERLLGYLAGCIRNYGEEGEPFTVVLLDSSHFSRELNRSRPRRNIRFFLSLYQILRGRIRSTDLVARPDSHLLAAVLPGMGPGDTRNSPLLAYVREQVAELQRSHGVFLSDPDVPEGMSVLSYPDDRARLLRRLGLNEGELEPYLNEERRVTSRDQTPPAVA